jgi:adenylate cyclase
MTRRPRARPSHNLPIKSIHYSKRLMNEPINSSEKETILVVDDTPDNLSLMAGLLKDTYRVKLANSGEKALAAVRGPSPPDLILLDIMMPGMSGYEVCEQLKQDPATRDIPIIFLTAMNAADDEKKGLDLGAADYLTKPVSPPIVLARVRNHLAFKRLRDLDQLRMVTMSEEKQLLELEQMKTDKLMLNILPRPIAERLKRGEKNISGSYAESTILFSDLVGFTELSSKISATELVKMLNDLFTRFDKRADRLGLEKIKTIGDAYMAAAGIPIPRSDHAELCADMALGMFEDLDNFNKTHGKSVGMRIGLNSGPVVAGVIGFTKFSYDLWGNTVNTASRMESTAPIGQTQVSTSTYELLKDSFSLQENGLQECKGLGLVNAYLLGSRSS